MAQEITLTMDGMLLNWLKNVGDSVNSGDVIAEVEADKATVEVEAPTSGVLLEQRAQSGDDLTEGAVIGMIGAADESTGPAPSQAAPGSEPERQAEIAQEQAAETPANGKAEALQAETKAASNGAQKQAQASSTTEDGRIKASPVAKKMAEEKGIDLNQVTGSGPGGRIIKEDVENFTPGTAPATAEPPAAVPAGGQGFSVVARKAPPESADVEYLEISNMRRRIAATTVESKQFIPHFYVTSECDVAALLTLRKQLNDNLAEGGVKISVNDLVVKATALTLRQFPNLNSHYYGDKLVRHKQINIGMAVALPTGVIYVVAHDADKMALGAMAAENKGMFERAREGKIKPADIQGATFSTSNLGGFDVDSFVAVINPPESGVLAIGTAQKVPVVQEDGSLGVGNRMKVTISADHRVSDGAEAGAFLQTFKALIENPLRLVM